MFEADGFDLVEETMVCGQNSLDVARALGCGAQILRKKLRCTLHNECDSTTYIRFNVDYD